MKLFLKITITAMVLLGCYLFIPKGYDAYKKHQNEKKMEADQKKAEEKLERLREKYSILLQDAYDDKNDPYTQFNALEKIVNAPSEVVSMLNLREDHMYNLAIYYLNGHGTIENLKKASHWFRKYYESPATFGEYKINAMFNVAWINYETEDYRETDMLLNKIIENKTNNTYPAYYDALHLLGILYYKGAYHIKNEPKALQLWEEAAGGGNTYAYLGGSMEDILAINHKTYKDSVSYLQEDLYLPGLSSVRRETKNWCPHAAKSLYEHYQAFNEKYGPYASLHTWYEAKKWRERHEVIMYAQQRKEFD